MSENRKKTERKLPPQAFKPGKSGNPNGRPRRTPEELDLVAACKDKTQEALTVMLGIMHAGANERNKLAAAMAIIERGHGKVIQPTTISGVDGSAIDMSMTVTFVKPS